jgi:hypothetical protein
MPQQMYPTMVNVPSFFPQPIGNVYSLQTASEIGNIPAGNGLSVGLCLSEGILYIKSLQNGAPMLVEYYLKSAESGRPQNETDAAPSEETKKIYAILEKYEEKISKLENQIKQLRGRGGEPEWQV